MDSTLEVGTAKKMLYSTRAEFRAMGKILNQLYEHDHFGKLSEETGHNLKGALAHLSELNSALTTADALIHDHIDPHAGVEAALRVFYETLSEHTQHLATRLIACRKDETIPETTKEDIRKIFRIMEKTSAMVANTLGSMGIALTQPERQTAMRR